MKGGSLMQYARDRYSQNGEDGVIEEVIRRLGDALPSRKTFLEFGAADGKTFSNTLKLAEESWSGVWIEADGELAARARERAAQFGDRVEVMHEQVTVSGDQQLDTLLHRTNLPYEFDFMSVDIDSYDLEVWESLRIYRARIVLIEINSGVPLGVEQVHGIGHGASFTSMLQVGHKKGYQLVCHTGNLLFVDASIAILLQLPDMEIRHPERLFNDSWLR